MKPALSVVNAAIEVRGVAFKPNAVIFTKVVKVEELNKMLAAVTEMEAGTAWWYGDLGLRLQEQAIAEKKGDDYTVGRAEILGISQGHWWDCVGVSRFYPPSDRSEVEGIHWTHHLVAMKGARGSLKIALNWLRAAAKEKWSVSELRKQVNLALATQKPPAGAPEENEFQAIDEIDAWLTKQTLPKLTAEQAKAQIVRWQALVAFIKHLEATAGL